MSSERTEYDVIVALYDAKKQKMANITFYNDTELLLNCTRVLIVREGDRLYFQNADSIHGRVKGSVKITGKKHNVLQSVLGYDLAKDMEGNYDLKYDKDAGMYYVDKNEIISEHEHVCSFKGRVVANYNNGNREKPGTSIKASVTKNGRGFIEMKSKPIEEPKIEETDILAEALLALLKEQVSELLGNEKALKTLSLLSYYIKQVK